MGCVPGAAAFQCRHAGRSNNLKVGIDAREHLAVGAGGGKEHFVSSCPVNSSTYRRWSNWRASGWQLVEAAGFHFVGLSIAGGYDQFESCFCRLQRDMFTSVLVSVLFVVRMVKKASDNVES